MKYQKEITLELTEFTIDLTITHGSVSEGVPQDFKIEPMSPIRISYLNEHLEDQKFSSYSFLTVIMHEIINSRLETPEGQYWYEDYIIGYEEAHKEHLQELDDIKADRAYEAKRGL